MFDFTQEENVQVRARRALAFEWGNPMIRAGNEGERASTAWLGREDERLLHMRPEAASGLKLRVLQQRDRHTRHQASRKGLQARALGP